MKALLLLLFWLWLTPQAWGGGSKKDPPYFSNYNMDFIKNTQTLWGRMVTTCANGKPAFFVWDPLTQPGDKQFVRSESSRTQTFDESQPDNVPERVAHWKKLFGYHVNSKVRAEIAKLLTNHRDCLFPQHYSDTQLNESLHRLLNALTRMRTASATYMEAVLTYLIHLFNVKKFTKAWANPQKFGLTHDHLRKLAPLFVACLECNMPIPTRYEEALTIHSMWKSTNPLAKEFPKTCDTRFGLPTRQLPPGLSEEALKDVDEGDSEEIDKDLETVAGEIWD